MTTFYLIRHANTDFIGKVLCGRMSGFHLNAEGREQAERLAERFRGIGIDSLYSSPLERALETAEPLAKAAGLTVRTTEEVSEVEYGEWTGRAIADLRSGSVWGSYNTFRTAAQIPGGESVLQLQNRIAGWMERIRREQSGERVAVVSHADPIKAAVTHYAGMHLDMFCRFEISPASVTVIQVRDAGPSVLALNSTAELPG
jgi:probable phosphoglycerate mutase